jgi:hypothetical protein
MVDALPPATHVSLCSHIANGEPPTVGLAKVEPDEEKDDTGDDEEEAHEVELGHVLAQALALMRVQVEEEEQHNGGDASSRPGRC